MLTSSPKMLGCTDGVHNLTDHHTSSQDMRKNPNKEALSLFSSQDSGMHGWHFVVSLFMCLRAAHAQEPV